MEVIQWVRGSCLRVTRRGSGSLLENKSIILIGPWYSPICWMDPFQNWNWQARGSSKIICSLKRCWLRRRMLPMITTLVKFNRRWKSKTHTTWAATRRTRIVSRSKRASPRWNWKLWTNRRRHQSTSRMMSPRIGRPCLIKASTRMQRAWLRS